MSAGALESQKGASIPLELDLEAIVSYLTLVLGTKLKESARALCTLSLSLYSTPLICVSSDNFTQYFFITFIPYPYSLHIHAPPSLPTQLFVLFLIFKPTRYCIS